MRSTRSVKDLEPWRALSGPGFCFIYKREELCCQVNIFFIVNINKIYIFLIVSSELSHQKNKKIKRVVYINLIVCGRVSLTQGKDLLPH